MKKVIGVILFIIAAIGIAVFKNITKENIKQNSIQSALDSETNKEEENLTNQNWFYNTQFGLVFETPKRITETNFPLPNGLQDYINNAYSYIFQDNDIAINYLIMETKFKKYNTKEGLRGAISNLMNYANGTNLQLDFYEVTNKYEDIGCTGTCLYKDITVKIKGYCLFKKSRVYILIATGQ